MMSESVGEGGEDSRHPPKKLDRVDNFTFAVYATVALKSVRKIRGVSMCASYFQ